MKEWILFKTDSFFFCTNMINTDSTIVALETSEELKEILEGNNEITLIYLVKDITLTMVIST
mgnify:CR=1 FL=1